MRESSKDAKGGETKERERGGSITILYYTLVLMLSTYVSFIEFSCFTCITIWGSLHYRTWLVYSNDELPQNALGLHEQASWMHPCLLYTSPSPRDGLLYSMPS